MFLGIGMGRSAVAVIRVSGPKATEVAVKMGRIKKDLLVPRKACLRNLVDPENGGYWIQHYFYGFLSPIHF